MGIWGHNVRAAPWTRSVCHTMSFSLQLPFILFPLPSLSKATGSPSVPTLYCGLRYNFSYDIAQSYQHLLNAGGCASGWPTEQPQPGLGSQDYLAFRCLHPRAMFLPCLPPTYLYPPLHSPASLHHTLGFTVTVNEKGRSQA